MQGGYRRHVASGWARVTAPASTGTPDAASPAPAMPITRAAVREAPRVRRLAERDTGAIWDGARVAITGDSEPRRQRWEEAANWPLTVAAVLFLAAYAWPILVPALRAPWPDVFQAVAWIAWGMFALDYLVRLALSRSRRAFVGANLVDLAVVALPLLRPLRLLRLVTLLNVLNRYAGASLRGRVAVYVSGSVVLVLFVASLAVLDAERGREGANIATFGDALWWAMTTVTTVGYGDRFPVSGAGRMIAGGLMLAGIALLGVVTASLASWLLEKVQEVEEDSQAATRRDVAALTREVVALREALERDDRDSSDATGPR